MHDLSAEHTDQAGMRRSARVLTAIAAGTPLAAWTWGQAWRDETWFSGLCFYIPSPVLAVWLVGIACLLYRSRARSSARFVLALALAPLSAVIGFENQWSHPRGSGAAAVRASATPLKIVHWNVKHGDRGWDKIAEKLATLDADAYCLSEAPYMTSDDRFPGYRVVWSNGMAILARGELTDPDVLVNDGALNAFVCEWRHEQHEMRLMMADIGATLTLHRDPQLTRLNRLIVDQEPDLVLGDLNAPRRSRGLSPPVGGYRHAYETAGAGWSYTWPVPIPVYAIDQILVAKRVKPLRHAISSSSLSDHRMQILEFELPLEPDR